MHDALVEPPHNGGCGGIERQDEAGATPAIGQQAQRATHGRRAQADPDPLRQMRRQRSRRPVAEAIAQLGRRLLHRLAERAAGDRVRLARSPRPRAVLQPALPFLLIALHPALDRGLVALEDGGDLREGVATARQEHHADPLTDPSDRAAGQLFQPSPFAVRQRTHTAHSLPSAPVPERILPRSSPAQNFCHFT